MYLVGGTCKHEFYQRIRFGIRGLGDLGLSPTSTVDASLIPSERTIRGQVEQMVSLGPRLTGSPAHRAWIDHLENGLTRAGVSMSRDHFNFTRWSARSWSLEVLDGQGAGPVPVSSYFPYSGATGPAGVEAPLAYAGPVPVPSITGNVVDLLTNEWALERWQRELATDLRSSLAAVPGGIQGKIVLLEAPVPPLSAGDFTLLSYATVVLGLQLVAASAVLALGLRTRRPAATAAS